MWFAFKLISLSYWIQRAQLKHTLPDGCDLLSNLYLCHIEYSIKNGLMYCILLWFAFKLISLSYWIQLISYRPVRKDCCDLLSNLYLCHIEYSPLWPYSRPDFVVICFQTYIFVILNTAIRIAFISPNSCDLLSNLYLCHIEYSYIGRRCYWSWLWFAFKLISLSYWIQP